MYTISSPAELDMELVEGQVLKRQLFKPKLPYPLWDYNWDGRMTEDTSMQGQMEGRGDVYGTIRHIILVRHGQYEENVDGVDGDKNDKLRKLTPLGRIQAEQTGKRLAKIQQGIDEQFGPCDIKIVRSSDMTRAKETAAIIAKHLKGVKLAKPDRLLNECLPAAIIPTRDLNDPDTMKEIDESRGRVERVFKAHIFRGPQGPEDRHEFEVIVCHGNIIRYFFCRCLQLPPEAWLRMSIFNCSITYLVLRPSGFVSARMLGDIGHLDYDQCSFSMNHGFVW